MSNNLYNIFYSYFQNHSSRTFSIDEDYGSLTYHSVHEMSSQYANFLAQLGVKPGDRVCSIVEKSISTILLYLACLRIGAIYLPLNNSYTNDELNYFIQDSDPTLIILDPKRLSQTIRLHPNIDESRFLGLDKNGNGSLRNGALECANTFTTMQIGENNIAAILYSSGTTGKPKGAMMSHNALAKNALGLKKIWRLQKEDTVLHCLPVFHTHGLFVALNTVLMSAAKLLFHKRFEPQSIGDDIHKCTIFMGVPTYYIRLIQSNCLSRNNTKNTRLFISGSAPLSQKTHKKFEITTGHKIIERYGMTESGIVTSSLPNKCNQAGSVGRAIEGMVLRVEPNSTNTSGVDQRGEIQIKGTSLFSGYWKQSNKTKECFTKDGFFKTGDIGALDKNNNLEIVGRQTDMFISGGFNIFPKEIETCIETINWVIEAAVIGMAHPDFGEAGLALVKIDGELGDKEDQINKLIDNKLVNYKRPKLIIAVQDLPKNTMGKLQKSILKNTYQGHSTAYLRATEAKAIENILKQN